MSEFASQNNEEPFAGAANLNGNELGKSTESCDLKIGMDNVEEATAKTIDSLPDEMLEIIFKYLNFHEHLGQSCVSKRWFNVIQNDPVFMRTVNMVADQKMVKEMQNRKLTRIYKTVEFREFDENVISDIEINLLSNAEMITFVKTFQRCNEFTYSSDLMKMLNHSKQLKVCIINSKPFKAAKITAPYMKPVQLTISSPSCQSVECFGNITHLKVSQWGYDSNQINVLKKYASAIDSLDIIDTRIWDSLKQITEIENLHLKTITMENYSSEYLQVLTEFFRRQQANIIKFTFRQDFLKRELFDAVRLSLTNLEVVEIQIDCTNIRLSDLNVLPHLRRLVVQVDCDERPFFVLDVSDLRSLTDLSVFGWIPDCLEFYEIENIPSKLLKLVEKTPPMLAMKMLTLDNMRVTENTIQNIAELMPNLVKLYINFEPEKFNLNGAVNAINQLVHLEILDVPRALIDNSFMNGLQLPQLRQIRFVKEPRFDNLITCPLMENCPKLSVILYDYYEMGKRYSMNIYADKTTSVTNKPRTEIIPKSYRFPVGTQNCFKLIDKMNKIE